MTGSMPIAAATSRRTRRPNLPRYRGFPPRSGWSTLHGTIFIRWRFCPASFAKVDRQTLEQLDAGTRKRLLDKAAVRGKGAWKRLYERFTTH